MIYQLSNGKIVYLSLEQFLDMTDEELEELLSYNFGSYAENPFHDTATKKRGRQKPKSEDTSIDFTLDDDELAGPCRTIDEIIDSLDEIIDENFDNLDTNQED